MRIIFFLIPLLLIVPFADAYAAVYSSTVPGSFGHLTDNNNDNICNGTTLAQVASPDPNIVGTFATTNTVDCRRAYFDFDISSIPDTATIHDVVLKYEIVSATNAKNCDYVSMGATRGSDSAASIWSAIGSGTVYLNNDATCASIGTGLSVDLGATADSDVQSLLASDYFSFGIKHDSETQDGSDHSNHFDMSAGTPAFTLEITYAPVPAPEAVDDLISTDITDTTVDLSWSEPNLNGTGALDGYQIKYGTPWTDTPNIILTNNTESTDTTSQISGLTELTQYSFQIGVWTESYNGTGNVLNVTTLEDFALANYTLGFLDVNATNDDIIQMFFERQNINATSLFLNVTYPNTYDLVCDLDYEFANTNQTYSNLANVTVSASAVESSFQFVDVENEIIRVNCWDSNNPENDGQYLITQTSFPLLDQIDSFRNGTYGTAGQIGVIDVITLMVIIISFIGFNRVNEAVGGIFTIMILASTAYFGIIELPTVIFGGIAIVLMLIITTVRKQ